MGSQPGTPTLRLTLTLPIWPALLLGCQSQPAPSAYETLSGVVVGKQLDTGDLVIEVARSPLGEPQPRTIYGVVTKDTEIYIRDRLQTLAEVEVGDAVDLVVTRDTDRRLERYAVCFAYIRRAPAQPPPPDPLAGP
jgi:hypothetical protein